uniref:Uncharacterized protein n=1 Tax=viral metagenome TaxID=1070528 RepID=A0A6C0DHG0_9ZZZZ
MSDFNEVLRPTKSKKSAGPKTAKAPKAAAGPKRPSVIERTSIARAHLLGRLGLEPKGVNVTALAKVIGTANEGAMLNAIVARAENAAVKAARRTSAKGELEEMVAEARADLIRAGVAAPTKRNVDRLAGIRHSGAHGLTAEDYLMTKTQGTRKRKGNNVSLANVGPEVDVCEQCRLKLMLESSYEGENFQYNSVPSRSLSRSSSRSRSRRIRSLGRAAANRAAASSMASRPSKRQTRRQRSPFRYQGSA